MLKRLRIKFVAMCMALITAVLAVVFLSIYQSAKRDIGFISHQVLQRVLEESVLPGTHNRPNLGLDIDGSQVLLPYFTVDVWGDSAYVTGGTYSDLEDTQALRTIVETCLDREEAEGTIPDYNLRYLRKDNGLFLKIAFVDMSMELATLREMMNSYLRIGLAAFLLLLGVSSLLARWAVRPVERAWKQQRQFLSDASHELKTPLTVILSNAELLEAAPLEDRPARWADNIRSEARQMKKLVEEMLTLARADNMTQRPVLGELSLSELVTDCALTFEPVAFEAGKPLDTRVEEGLTVLGDGDRLRRLVMILLDNAVKYGADGGAITLDLSRSDRQARLTVSNPGEPIPPEQLAHLFERFYRTDGSRGEKEGFGLGLSIALAIAGEHRGSLRAESDSASTRFIFTVPLKR